MRFKITYLAATVLYIDGGRDHHLSMDDTLRVERNGKTLGTIKVTAVSRQSSAAVTLTQAVPFVVGDAAVILK
ncbi:MAG TPA: hypothetical protein VK470_10265, partial [Bacteroidota bacterium]|nr:hypothetical protein [Bacteroidota bacterium]